MDKDDYSRITRPGALVITPAGRLARVVREVEKMDDKPRVEVEYLEVDRVLIDPMLLRRYSKPTDDDEGGGR